MKAQKIEISLKTILWVLGILLLGYFVYQIGDILLFAFIGILLMAAINPAVRQLTKWKLNRSLSIGIIYVVMIAVIVAVVALIVPPLVKQIALIVSQIPIPPDLADNLKHLNLSLQDMQVIANQLDSVPKVLQMIGSAFSGVIVFVSLLMFAFYLLAERNKLRDYLMAWYKDKQEVDKRMDFIEQVENQIGAWVRGELSLMLIVGTMTYVGLLVLRVDYALLLAILAGLLEILPNLGPIISAIPAIAIAYLMVSPWMAVAVAVLYIIVQQVENNLIVPLVMRQAVGLSPVVTILLLLIGYRLAGVAGAALAIPMFLVMKVIVVELYKLRNHLE